MNRTALGLIAATIAALVGCSGTPRTPEQARNIHLLASWMSGTFTSEAQAAADPEHYYNVRLVMVPIWTERTDGRWLYVEQALATALDKPYRQRIYRLTSEGDSYISSVFTLPGDPLEFSGAWAEPGRFGTLSPEQISPRGGCDIVMQWDAQRREFQGGTTADDCPSDLRGARYSTSQVRISATDIISWDRGFDAQGNQVWGATTGGYQFVKVAR